MVLIQPQSKAELRGVSWSECRPLVDWLSTPQAYPDVPKRVEVIETHISWVFLTDRHAYKMKKPVRFDFLDFSSLDLRKEACEAEVRLNRRMAGGVYTGVIPVTLDPAGKYQMGRTGKVVEWLVQMYRLDEKTTLAHKLADKSLSVHDLESLAGFLSDFYSQAAPLTLTAQEYRCDLEKNVAGNYHELLNPFHRLPLERVQRVHNAQRQFLRVYPHIFDQRVCDGRIIEGHGDLRPEHIYLEHVPKIIDCVEFNPTFRRLDAADDLAFLAMECDRLGEPKVGRRIFDVYRQRSADHLPSSVWNFYRSYRACVRAKVFALRADQVFCEEREKFLRRADEYLYLADGYRNGVMQPFLLVVGGLMGTGKSTLTESLAETLGLEWLQTDHIRRNHFGASPREFEYEKGFYTPELREQVYAEMFRRAEAMLSQGESVILDGTFLKDSWRGKALALARQMGTPALFVSCELPRSKIMERLHLRSQAGVDLSEGRAELYDQQALQLDPWGDDLPLVVIDTSEGIADQVRHVCRALERHVPLIA